jgi:hypothetical protein
MKINNISYKNTDLINIMPKGFIELKLNLNYKFSFMSFQYECYTRLNMHQKPFHAYCKVTVSAVRNAD